MVSFFVLKKRVVVIVVSYQKESQTKPQRTASTCAAEGSQLNEVRHKVNILVFLITLKRLNNAPHSDLYLFMIQNVMVMRRRFLTKDFIDNSSQLILLSELEQSTDC